MEDVKKVSIAAVVVTYNRKELLGKCLEALLHQTKPLDSIIIIDNDSTDGTGEFLKKFYLHNQIFNYSHLPENIGGAGGFYEGFKKGYELGFDWLWVMDDDAEPANDALEEIIVNSGLDETKAFGCLPVVKNSDLLSWPHGIYLNGKRQKANSLGTIKKNNIKLLKCISIGFLGGLYSKTIISKVGFPDSRLFIRGDEKEYSLRIKKHGFGVYRVFSSIIYHPGGQYREVNFLFKKFWFLKAPIWKSYYDIRNIIFRFKYYSVFEAYFIRFPWLLLKTFYILLLYEDKKKLRFKYYLRALRDGILGKMGKTVEPGEI